MAVVSNAEANGAVDDVGETAVKTVAETTAESLGAAWNSIWLAYKPQ
jgi:hypothetical protein